MNKFSYLDIQIMTHPDNIMIKEGNLHNMKEL
jgi:hypothetical protein